MKSYLKIDVTSVTTLKTRLNLLKIKDFFVTSMTLQDVTKVTENVTNPFMGKVLM